MIFPVMRPNIRGDGWVPGRLGQCPKFDQIFILMASLILVTGLFNQVPSPEHL